MGLRHPVPRAKWHSTNDQRICRDRCYFVFTVKLESDLSVCSTCSWIVTVALIFVDCGTQKLKSIESDQHSGYFLVMNSVHDGAVICDKKELLLLKISREICTAILKVLCQRMLSGCVGPTHDSRYSLLHFERHFFNLKSLAMISFAFFLFGGRCFFNLDDLGCFRFCFLWSVISTISNLERWSISFASFFCGASFLQSQISSADLVRLRLDCFSWSVISSISNLYRWSKSRSLRSLLPRSVEKRRMRLRLEIKIEIERHSKCRRLYLIPVLPPPETSLHVCTSFDLFEGAMPQRTQSKRTWPRNPYSEPRCVL